MSSHGGENMPPDTSEEGGQQEELATQISEGSEEEEVPKIVPEMIKGIYSEDPEIQLECVQSLRKVLSRKTNIPFAEVIEAGLIPVFIQFLQQTESNILQFEAAWILKNIASSVHYVTVMEAGAIPIFITLLRSPHEDVQEQAVCALGHIASGNPKSRNYVLDQEVMLPLLELLGRCTKISMIRSAVWCLKMLCYCEYSPPEFSQVSPCLPTLARLLFHSDPDVLVHVCWTIAHLSDVSDEPNISIQAVIDSGMCKRLVELLLHQAPSVVNGALEAVGNIVTGDDEQVQVILNNNVLPNLLPLLKSAEDLRRKKTCWTISNITAGSQQQIQAVIDANIIATLVDILCEETSISQHDAAVAITNAISGGTSEQIKFIVSHGCIKPLCNLLFARLGITIRVLDALDEILKVGEKEAKSVGGPNKYALEVEECSGIRKIKYLQDDENEYVCGKAYELIDQYFKQHESLGS